jgi:hypothetical protein
MKDRSNIFILNVPLRESKPASASARAPALAFLGRCQALPAGALGRLLGERGAGRAGERMRTWAARWRPGLAGESATFYI